MLGKFDFVNLKQILRNSAALLQFYSRYTFLNLYEPLYLRMLAQYGPTILIRFIQPFKAPVNNNHLAAR